MRWHINGNIFSMFQDSGLTQWFLSVLEGDRLQVQLYPCWANCNEDYLKDEDRICKQNIG
jgi:hypothetical protein